MFESTDSITPAQIRSARGMLDWSMVDLASAAGVSISTIKRLETGQAQMVSEATSEAVRRGLEAAGLRFIGDARTAVGVVLIMAPSPADAPASTIAGAVQADEVLG